jgi:hypothetical protein
MLQGQPTAHVSSLKLCVSVLVQLLTAIHRYLLLCGSTLLSVADPHVEFFQSQLKPWIHYVPVAQDFSDLNARLQWLGDHQAEAQRIGEAGRDWAMLHLHPDSLVRMTLFFSIVVFNWLCSRYFTVGLYHLGDQGSGVIAKINPFGSVDTAIAPGHQARFRYLTC